MPTQQQVDTYKALIASYRALADLIDFGGDDFKNDSFLAEAAEEAGFRAIDYRKKHGIEKEHLMYGVEK